MVQELMCSPILFAIELITFNSLEIALEGATQHLLAMDNIHGIPASSKLILDDFSAVL